METVSAQAISNTYLVICILSGLFFIASWIWRKWNLRTPDAVSQRSVRRYDFRAQLDSPLLHGTTARILGNLPLNEILQLATEELTFTLDVDPRLDGLKICQLSDLHFTGQTDIRYFQAVIEKANEFEPDLVLITGDLLDQAECLSWLESTLGRLKATLGCYYVLGNHDRRILDEPNYRDQLQAVGLIRAAGEWIDLNYQGAAIRLTGNELPWYPGAESLRDLPADAEKAMTILLSHSPDQLEWAMPYDFDLMFAGHTHGGQIALPWIGPLVAPSKFGVRYAAGNFQIGKMLMHVSRGLSGDDPIRWCCPPELGLFQIRASTLCPEQTKA